MGPATSRPYPHHRAPAQADLHLLLPLSGQPALSALRSPWPRINTLPRCHCQCHRHPPAPSRSDRQRSWPSLRCRHPWDPCPRPPLPGPNRKTGDWDSLPPGLICLVRTILNFSKVLLVSDGRRKVPNPGLRSVMPGRPDSVPGDRHPLLVPSPIIK